MWRRAPTHLQSSSLSDPLHTIILALETPTLSSHPLRDFLAFWVPTFWFLSILGALAGDPVGFTGSTDFGCVDWLLSLLEGGMATM